MKERQSLARVAVIVLLTSAGLAGCAEYMDRKDTIAFNAGEAVQTNIVTHVPDPWPVHSRNKNIAFSGERMARAVRRYECGPPSARGGSSQSAISAASTPGSSAASSDAGC